MKCTSLKLKSIAELVFLVILFYLKEVSLLVFLSFWAFRLIKNLYMKEFYTFLQQPFPFIFLVFVLLKFFFLEKNLVVALGFDEVIIPYVIIPLMIALEFILLVMGIQKRRRKRR